MLADIPAGIYYRCMDDPRSTNLEILDQAAASYSGSADALVTEEMLTFEGVDVDKSIKSLRSLIDDLPRIEAPNSTIEVGRETIGTITILTNYLVTHCIELIEAHESIGIDDTIEAAQFVNTCDPAQVERFLELKQRRMWLANSVNDLAQGYADEDTAKRARTLAESELAALDPSLTPEQAAHYSHFIRAANAALTPEQTASTYSPPIDIALTQTAWVLRDLQLAFLTPGTGNSTQIDSDTLYRLRHGTEQLCRAVIQFTEAAETIAPELKKIIHPSLPNVLNLIELAKDNLGSNFYEAEAGYRLALVSGIFHLLDGRPSAHTRHLAQTLATKEMSW